MPVVDKNQLKIWFKNLAKPVQEQFWNWMDSFYHKSEPIPQNGVENLTTDLAKKADLVGGVVPASQLPFTVNTSEVIAIGEITTTANSVTMGVHSSGTNAVRLNGIVYKRQFPSSFNYTAVTTGNKFLIIYAINDSGLFRLAEGVEGLEAIEPELPAGALYVRRILITPNGQVVDNNLLSGFKEKKEDTWKIHTFLQAGVPNFLSFNDGRSSYILQKQNGLTGPFILGGIARKYDDDNWWGGKEFTILNFTGYDVELQNYPTFDSDTQATFSPSSTPYILKNGYIVKVKVSDDDYIMEVIRTSSSSDTDGVENKSDIDGATATEALNNLQAFNLGLLMGTNRPLLSRSAFSLISELDDNGWPKQMAWVSHDDKRVNIADIETGQTHSTLDTRDLITYGVSNALIQFVTKIYETTFPINMGVFVSMSMVVVYYPLPRQVTLRFTIDQAYNISNAKAYKLKINNTTSSAQVILDLTNATTVNGNELVITFLDNAQMEHTTEIQEFEIYKDGQDDSGIPTYNWQKANLQPRLEVITISANTTLSEIHNNKMLHVINSVTITYPVGLLKDFNFVMKAFGNIAVHHVANSGVTLNAADGTYLKNGAMGSVYAVSDNNLVLTGGFTTS